MASVASGLFKSLPKPKYTGEDEEIPVHAQQRGPRVLGAGALDETQVVLKVSAIFYHEIHSMGSLFTNYLYHRKPDHPRTVIEQDGDLGRPKISAMAALSQKYWWHNIR